MKNLNMRIKTMLIAMLAGALVMFFAYSHSVFASDSGGTAKIIMEDTIISVGNKVEMPIKVGGIAKEVSALGFSVKYNAKMLELVEVKLGSATQGWSKEHKEYSVADDNNKIMIAMASAKAIPLSANAEIAVLVFSVKQAGAGRLTILSERIEIDDISSPCVVEGGNIKPADSTGEKSPTTISITNKDVKDGGTLRQTYTYFWVSYVGGYVSGLQYRWRLDGQSWDDARDKWINLSSNDVWLGLDKPLTEGRHTFYVQIRKDGKLLGEGSYNFTVEWPKDFSEVVSNIMKNAPEGGYLNQAGRWEKTAQGVKLTWTNPDLKKYFVHDKENKEVFAKEIIYGVWREGSGSLYTGAIELNSGNLTEWSNKDCSYEDKSAKDGAYYKYTIKLSLDLGVGFARNIVNIGEVAIDMKASSSGGEKRGPVSGTVLGPNGYVSDGSSLLTLRSSTVPPYKRIALYIRNIPAYFELQNVYLKLGGVTINRDVASVTDRSVKVGNNIITQFTWNGDIKVILDAEAFNVGSSYDLKYTLTGSDGSKIENNIKNLKITADSADQPWPQGQGFGIMHNGQIIGPSSLLFGTVERPGVDQVMFKIGGFEAAYDGEFEIWIKGRENLAEDGIEGTITSSGKVTIRTRRGMGGSAVFNKKENTFLVTLFVEFKVGSKQWADYTNMDGAKIRYYFHPSDASKGRGCKFRSGWVEGLTFVSPQGPIVMVGDDVLIRQNSSIRAEAENKIEVNIRGIPYPLGEAEFDFQTLSIDRDRKKDGSYVWDISSRNGNRAKAQYDPVAGSVTLIFDFSKLLNNRNKLLGSRFTYYMEVYPDVRTKRIEGGFRDIVILRDQPLAVILTYPPAQHINRDAVLTAEGLDNAQYSWKLDDQAYTGYSPETSITYRNLPLGRHTARMKMFLEGREYYSEEVAWEIIVDTTGPSKPVVTDDGAYTANASSLHASWTASADAESGIAEYQYAIGTTQGGDKNPVWTSTGKGISVTKPGLSLTNGRVYYFSVQAKNGAGLWSLIGYSDGIKVDTTAPGKPIVVSFRSFFPLVGINVSDAESKIVELQYAVGTTAAGTDALGWTKIVANNQWFGFISMRGLGLKAGKNYYISVKAKNGVGLWSAIGVCVY